jgi:dihydrofolate reductase
MGTIIVTEFVSLDGVMEAPGGGESYKHHGWTFEINRGKEGDQFKLDEALDAEALLLGRVTYQGFAAAWPTRKGELADKFNSMPKYVISSTLDKRPMEQHYGAQGQRGGERRESEEEAAREYRCSWQRPPRASLARRATRSDCTWRSRRRSATGSSF